MTSPLPPTRDQPRLQLLRVGHTRLLGRGFRTLLLRLHQSALSLVCARCWIQCWPFARRIPSVLNLTRAGPVLTPENVDRNHEREIVSLNISFHLVPDTDRISRGAVLWKRLGHVSMRSRRLARRWWPRPASGACHQPQPCPSVVTCT